MILLRKIKLFQQWAMLSDQLGSLASWGTTVVTEAVMYLLEPKPPPTSRFPETALGRRAPCVGESDPTRWPVLSAVTRKCSRWELNSVGRSRADFLPSALTTRTT